MPRRRGQKVPAARVEGGVIGSLFVISLLILTAVWVPPALRAIRAARADGRLDRPAAVLTLAIARLPSERAAWGQAMLVELHHANGLPARWQFSLGCVRAVAAIRLRAALGAPGRGATGMRAILLSTVGAAIGLETFGLVRYPALRALTSTSTAAVVLLVALAGYALSALTLLRGTSAPAARARRSGVVAGVATGLAWLVVLSPTGLKTWMLLALLLTLISPASVAVLTARATRDPTIATSAALWSGLVGGLLVFVAWIGSTYLDEGRPYDPQLIRDFHRSRLHDLAAYAVNANLDTALTLLLLIPIVSLALGSLAGRSAANRRR